MDGEINGPMLHLSARRILSQIILAVPILRRSNRSGNEAAATIGTDVVQHVFYTSCAERTFIGTDARIAGIRRQCLVAVFASRSKFQHGVPWSEQQIKAAHSTCLRYVGLYDVEEYGE